MLLEGLTIARVLLESGLVDGNGLLGLLHAHEGIAQQHVGVH